MPPALPKRDGARPFGGCDGLLLGAFRAVSADLKSEIRASEARQEKQMGELRKANEVLAGKADLLLDAFRVAKT